MRRPEPVRIGGREVGAGAPAYVIAEAGVNHNGDPSLARWLIEAARGAGADAVKFQTFVADRLVTADAPQAAYQVQGEPIGQHEMLRRLELSPAVYRDLARRCRELGLDFLSTPFDRRSADLLEEIGVPAFKIGSGELTNLPLLAHVAEKGRPMLVSTGMATLAEVDDAVAAIRGAGDPPLVLLQCTSRYPAPAADANLRAMATLESAFGVPVGYSDHTRGDAVPLAAVALGACVVEKHLTLDRDLPGPDHRASVEPDEFAALVRRLRDVEAALGDGVKRPSALEREIAAVARRSLVAARDVRAGGELSERDVIERRPGTGLSPAMRPRVIGRKARAAIPAGALIDWEMLA